MYLRGFNNEHQSESIPGTLPVGQNSPQHIAGDLVAEQVSGTAFTMPRADNRRSWLYRRRPSVRHLKNLTPRDHATLRSAPDSDAALRAVPLRWQGRAAPAEPVGWFESLSTVATTGSVSDRAGGAFHTYATTESMTDQAIANADGEFAIFPQAGALRLTTEFGILELEPCEFAVVPRGVMFRVELARQATMATGFVVENYGQPFRLPDAGLIGLNALAMPRDFLYPAAATEDDRSHQIAFKWHGGVHQTRIDHSPFDVVAWHGSHAPYKYDMRNYCPIGPVLFDHPDPSVWTLMTSPSNTVGCANLDLVVFRDRWLVAEDTFRPPWFHRNVMSEIMGMVHGSYDAKASGFEPGAISLHNSFVPHGPDAVTHQRASSADLEPVRLDPSIAVMCESRTIWQTSEMAINSPLLDHTYANCWDDIGPA